MTGPVETVLRSLLIAAVFASVPGAWADDDVLSLKPGQQIELECRAWTADLPGTAGNTIRFDAKRGVLTLATGGAADMWGGRAGAPIAWSAAPEGPFAVEVNVAYPSTSVSAVAGVCVYDADGGKPAFTLGLDHWSGTQKVKLQGLPPTANNPAVEAGRAGCRQVGLRLECYRRGGKRDTDVYLAYFRFDAKEDWSPLGALHRNVANQRVGLFLKSNDAQSAEFTDVVVTGVAEAELAARLKTFEKVVHRAAPPRKPLPVFEVAPPTEFKGHPDLDGQTIVFVARRQYRSDHHNTATMFQTGEINTGSFEGGGAIRAFDVDTGKVTTLLDLPDGVARDLEVSFDGTKLLFSMRRNAEDDYHIHEMNADGSDLRQLTFGSGISDIDPIYLPDGRILFGSSREPKFCMCNRHIMCNLFTMNGDGSNIEQIGHSTLFEGHPALLPDGRVLYDRWEYVDRNFGDAQGVWVTNPDGTNHAIYWGNNTNSPGAVLDTRPIPGTDLVVCTFSSCHDRPWGALAILDRKQGIDMRAGVVRTWPAEAIELVGQGNYDTFKRVHPKYEDPYPLSSNALLCSRVIGPGEKTGIVLLDTDGTEVLVYAEPDESPAGCFDPMPLKPRETPRHIEPRIDLAQETGVFYVSDVYDGTGMETISPGEVKWLRVVESPEKRFWTRTAWNGSGTQAPAMAFNDFNNKRILGTVPVEEDGSAHFEVPADTFLYFQLLDERGRMVQSMRSGTIVRPGEQQGCIGCHEDRLNAVPPRRTPKALLRGPSKLEPWYGEPRLFGYVAEVQPVFDRHCVKCHDRGGPGAEKVCLAGDLNLAFNTSYYELRTKNLVKVPGAGPTQILMPRSWGSYVSPLAKVVLDGHGDPERDKDLNLSAEEKDRVITWIDINAPYYPRYASAYRENRYGRSPINEAMLKMLSQLTGINLQDQRLSDAVSFSRPELSLCLEKLDAGSNEYKQALAIIEAGKANLAARPRADMPGFKLVDPIEIAAEEKYQRLLRSENEHRHAIVEGRKKYDHEQE